MLKTPKPESRERKSRVELTRSEVSKRPRSPLPVVERRSEQTTTLNPSCYVAIILILQTLSSHNFHVLLPLPFIFKVKHILSITTSQISSSSTLCLVVEPYALF